jgi:hypothetical protein
VATLTDFDTERIQRAPVMHFPAIGVKILGPWSLGLDVAVAGVGSSVSWQHGLKRPLISPQVNRPRQHAVSSTGCFELAEVQEDTRGLEGAGSRKELSIAEEGARALTVAEEVGGAADLGTLPPLLFIFSNIMRFFRVF